MCELAEQVPALFFLASVSNYPRTSLLPPLKVFQLLFQLLQPRSSPKPCSPPTPHPRPTPHTQTHPAEHRQGSGWNTFHLLTRTGGCTAGPGHSSNIWDITRFQDSQTPWRPWEAGCPQTGCLQTTEQTVPRARGPSTVLARRCLEGKHSHGQGQGLSLPFMAQNTQRSSQQQGWGGQCWLQRLQCLLYLGALAMCPCVSPHVCAATRVYMHVCRTQEMEILQDTG